jgi:hypothetical protein
MMKLLFMLCFSTALTFGAQQDSKPAPKSAKSEAPEKPLTAIPSSAVQIEPGAYRWTDSKGKKWILFQTPFGIAKKEDDGQPLRKKQQDPQIMQGVKITEDGDSLKFEREGPFGTYKWSKKKTDLSDEEKAAWERQQAAGSEKTDSSKNTTAKQD